MRKLEFNYSFELTFSDLVNDHLFELRILPSDNHYQKLQQLQFKIEPESKFTSYLDSFNNKVITGSISKAHDNFSCTVKGIMEVEYAKLVKEQAHPIFKFETELTRYDEAMAELIVEADSFYELMMMISTNIYYALYYTPNSTNINTNAKQAFEMRKGVCQDFAHVMLAVVRHLGYPARYVAGMMVGEGESHAWVEVYNNGKWYGFDPTNNRPVNNHYIAINKGRDYKDCALDKGIFNTDNFVNQDMKAHVSVKVI